MKQIFTNTWCEHVLSILRQNWLIHMNYIHMFVSYELEDLAFCFLKNKKFCKLFFSLKQLENGSFKNKA